MKRYTLSNGLLSPTDLEIHERFTSDVEVVLASEAAAAQEAGARQAAFFDVVQSKQDTERRLEALQRSFDTLRTLFEQRSVFDLVAHLERQRKFSEATFGPGVRTDGICDHIRKELGEVAAAPHDLSEWVDVVLLALDGAWRAGYRPTEICDAIAAKQLKNERRKWPDWRSVERGKAIEHDRTDE